MVGKLQVHHHGHNINIGSKSRVCWAWNAEKGGGVKPFYFKTISFLEFSLNNRQFSSVSSITGNQFRHFRLVSFVSSINRL